MEFLADENFNRRILRQLRQRAPEIRVVRVQDTEISGAADPDILAWAARYGYVVLTHDIATMPGYAYSRMGRGEAMLGLIVVPWLMTLGQAVDELSVVLVAGTDLDFESQVLFLPL